jgi:SAM-dependent methyltransferase
MNKLTEKTFWEEIYKTRDLINDKHPSWRKRLKSFLKKFIGRKILELLRNYDDYILWDVIYEKFLPKTKGIKAIEIGSAPGDYLVRFQQKFGFVPYGIEFTKNGVALNRKIFISNNLAPENVIHADFCSDEFHKQYKNYFDLVISRGFIEHFDDVEDIVEKHINLLKKGGYLIVSIPNLLGVNYILTWIFHHELIAIHNLSIMRKKEFLHLFNKENLITLFCDYYGTFTFCLFNTKRNSPMRFILDFCKILQQLLNLIFRLIFKAKGAETRLFSPFLLFIGRLVTNSR